MGPWVRVLVVHVQFLNHSVSIKGFAIGTRATSLDHSAGRRSTSCKTDSLSRQQDWIWQLDSLSPVSKGFVGDAFVKFCYPCATYILSVNGLC
jgi:hypothetical protein